MPTKSKIGYKKLRHVKLMGEDQYSERPPEEEEKHETNDEDEERDDSDEESEDKSDSQQKPNEKLQPALDFNSDNETM
jgi:BRCT domain type II-containing protein